MRRPRRPRLVAGAALYLAAGLPLATLSAQDSALRFNRDVRPVLSSNCFPCHGADAQARKAELRLDTWAGLTTERDGRAPVVPGEPGRSEMLRRITSDDPEVRMPPPESNAELDADDLETLRRWIAEGAHFERHWAFVPPRRPPVPDTGPDDRWSRTAIDRFIRARLDEAGLEPQPQADRATLIRRLCLDLTGLPPTLAQLDAFLADDRPDAYERLVDRLLESPHFGERMAQKWLDIARYADTNGFHHDNVRTAWPYRDWVIAAFNDDKPYDDFVVEQLAGDLLPDAEQADRVASAFCRMHNINDEGGAIDEEYRVEAVADRIETVSTAFLGLTMACARCHDHKYDPLTQEDYYSMYAFFDSVDERGVYRNNFDAARAYPARIGYRTPELQERTASVQAELDAVMAELAAVQPETDREREAWEQELRDARGITWLDNAEQADTVGETPCERLADGSLLLDGKPARESVRFTFRTARDDLRILRLDALPHESFTGGSLGLSNNGNAVVSKVTAEVVSTADPSRRHTVTWQTAWADYEQPNGDYDVLNLVHGGGDGWALGGHLRAGSCTALLIASAPFGFAEGCEVRVTVESRSRFSTHVVGRPRVQLAAAKADAGALADDLPLVAGDWWVSGPHRGGDFEALWERRFGPEDAAGIDRSQRFGEVGWDHRPDVDDGEIVPLRGERAVWYWARELRTAVAREVELRLGSDDALRAFLDGEELLADKVLRSVAADQNRVTFTVPPGEHLLVVKVVNNAGPAGFYGRLDTVGAAADALRPAAWVPQALRSADLDERVTRAFGRRSPTFARLDDARRELEGELDELDAEAVPMLVMDELPEPTPTYVLQRGRYDMPDHSRPVQRRPPEMLGGELPEGAPNDRLGFARWLTRPDHPLTARVQVNRIWELLFGTGLVATSENFGVQADWPSHPALLDHLATDFVADGWSQKRLIRRIVTSAVYRQRALSTPAAQAADPTGRLLAHFPRRRLDAEFVRDTALAASGLLRRAPIGGPSVKPYQPAGLWREVSIGGSSNTQVFQRDDGDALYRRSIYTFWKRTAPNPQMSTFDAPTREFCVVRRATTNTPLQALTLWNDTQFVEAARVLAQRVLRESDGPDELRIERMFRLCTGRVPDAADRVLLEGALADFRTRFADDAAAASDLLEVGEAPIPDARPAPELAAWTLLANAVLNLDETLVRD